MRLEMFKNIMDLGQLSSLHSSLMFDSFFPNYCEFRIEKLNLILNAFSQKIGNIEPNDSQLSPSLPMCRFR